MLRTAAGHCIFYLILGASAAYAQDRYSRAVSIDNSQFLAAVKEVSLNVEPEPSLAQYIPLAAQRNEIVSALSRYGIAVRPNAPVTLAVTVTHNRPVIEYRNTRTQAVDEKIAIHAIFMSFRFFVKAAALRNGKLHPVWAAVATSFSDNDLAEDNSTRKFLLGDTTRKDVNSLFEKSLGDCLKVLATTGTPEDATPLQKLREAAARQQAPANSETPWVVNSWTEKAKTAVDADFVRIMSPGAPVDKNPLQGLAGAPQIVLEPVFYHDDCKADPAWRSRWVSTLRRLPWTGSQTSPNLSLKHHFVCSYAYGGAPHYFALSDVIFLSEANLVFPLNGKLVRKWGDLLTAHHEELALDDGIENLLQAFVPRNIQEFLTDLVLGNASDDAPPVPSGAPSPAPRVVQPPPARQPVTPPAPPPPTPPPPAPPTDDPIGGGGFITAPSSFNALLCVPRNLIQSYSWDRPESGSRMDAFKRAAGAYVVSVAKPGYEYWIGPGQFERFDLARPASGATIVSIVSPDSGRFDAFNPQCPATYALYNVQINR